MLPSETQAIQEEVDSQENNSPTRSQSTQIYNDIAECTLATSNGTDIVLTHADPLIITSEHDPDHDTSTSADQRQRTTLAWPLDASGLSLTRQDGTAVALSPEGGVIVLGKMQQDGTVSALLPRDDCQDFVFMVELKYNKDMILPEMQTQHVLPQIQRDGSLKQPIIKARLINYVAEPEGVARQVIKGPQVETQENFTEDSSLTITKTNLLTYDAQGNPQNTCIAYPTSQSISLSKEISYIPDGQTLANAQTVTFEDSSHVGTLTKEQALSLMAGTSVLPNAQIISFAPDPGSNVGHIARTHLVSYTSDPPATEFVDTSVVVDPQLADLVYESENIAGEVPDIKPVQIPEPKPSEKPYPCTVCNKRFMRRTNLRSHMAHHTSERPHICETCGKSFALRWDLTLHCRLHTGVFSCEVCGKAFSVPGKLERHRRIHSGERPFACTQCGKAFSDKHNLDAHIRTHSDERPFSCQTCGNTFRSRSHLRAHRRVHTQDTPFTCHLCGKSFKWKANLNLHLKGHAGERAKCEGCGREFARSADLARHRRSHEGLRPHTCSLCTRTYADRGALNKHMKSHTEHRPYVCEICNKGFHYQWYLTAHKKVHDNVAQEKKFRCQHCDKEYCKKSTLTAHLKTHARNATVIESTQADSGGNPITIVSTLSLSTLNPAEPSDLTVSPDHTEHSNPIETSSMDDTNPALHEIQTEEVVVETVLKTEPLIKADLESSSSMDMPA